MSQRKNPARSFIKVGTAVGAIASVIQPGSSALAWPGVTLSARSGLADNAEHTYGFMNVEPSTAEMVRQGMANLDQQTDFWDVAVQVGSHTDVVVYDEDYVGFIPDGSQIRWDDPYLGIDGYADCRAYLPGAVNVCDSHRLRFDLSDSLAMTSTGRKTLSCHEIGHTTGLGHAPDPLRNSTCMISGRSQYVQYDADEVAVLNSHY